MKNFSKIGPLGLNQTEQNLLSMSELGPDNIRDERVIEFTPNYKEQRQSLVAVSTFARWSVKAVFLCKEGEICELKEYWEVTAYDYHYYDVILVSEYLHIHSKDEDKTRFNDSIDLANCYFEEAVTIRAIRILAGDPYSADYMSVEFGTDSNWKNQLK